MADNILVSAIIPTYNREAVVGNAVESVLNQTYKYVEAIVVDDGSSDGTQEQLKRYGNRITVVAQKNAGPAAARNRGIRASHGQLIAFLDSDDVWLPNKLERQVSLLQRVGPAVPCCLCNIMMQWSAKAQASFDIAWLKPSADEGVWLNVEEVLATRFVLFNQGIMVRREAIEKVGGFDESLRLLEDHELALRLSLQGPWAFIREPLVVWHETMGSLYHSAQSEQICEKEIEVLQKHLANLDSGEQYQNLRKHLVAGMKRARRQIIATRMSNAEYWSILGTVLQKVERYRSALLRRSPLFPKMKIVPIGL